MSLKDENLRFVLLKAIADAAAEELGKMRDAHLTPLLERYDDDGTKSFEVRLPGSQSLVATISLGVPKDSIEVDDDAAFTAWLEQHHADVVSKEFIPGEPERTVVVPATPDRTETTIDPKGLTAVMKHFKHTEDGIVDTATGVVVDGVKHVPGARPKSFAVKYDGDGRELLAAAYRAGKLDQVVAGTTLPQVGGVRTVVERRLESVQLHSATVDGRPHFTVPGEVAAEVAAEVTPVAPPEDQAPVQVSSIEDAFGEDAPARYGSEEWGDDLTGRALYDDEDDFDPGDWGASSPATGSGW